MLLIYIVSWVNNIIKFECLLNLSKIFSLKNCYTDYVKDIAKEYLLKEKEKSHICVQ